MTRILSGISDVIDAYDGFILDLWGVIHDGQSPYPGVVECLTKIKQAGKPVCLLSNAPRRREPVIEKLTAMGIDRSLYTDVMTSGEATWQALKTREDDWYKALQGRKCYHIGPGRDHSVLVGQDIDIVENPEEADFVVNTGIHHFGETVADYEPVLQACFKAGLPMICANPDLVVVVAQSDTLVICAGGLAARYEELGGDVKYHGKPYKEVYDICMQRLDITDRGRILAVGDSLHTDIKGALGAGIDCALVIDGIHRDDIGLHDIVCTNDNQPKTELEAQKIEQFLNTTPNKPTTIMPRFVW